MTMWRGYGHPPGVIAAHEEEALDALLGQVHLTWRKSGSQYVIVHRRPVRPDAAVTVSGTVVDSLTGHPLENAIAFLAGTTVGANSDERGEFRLRSDRAGRLDLVIALVGYERRVIRIEADPGDSLFRPVVLSPRVLPQEQIEVTSFGSKEWESNFALFQKIVCGSGEYADRCRAVNPFVVNLHLSGNTLTARSDSILWIENAALGYRIGVVVGNFHWNVDRDDGKWLAYVFFRNMTPESRDQRAEWMENRKSVYRGSLRHFLWALVHGRVIEEGFTIRAGKWSDSRMWKLLGPDAIPLEQYPGTRLLEWTYRRMIRVDYNPQVFPPSFLRLVDEFALVDSSGVLATPLAYELGGKWGWERMGRMLPYDYSPEDIQ